MQKLRASKRHSRTGIWRAVTWVGACIALNLFTRHARAADTLATIVVRAAKHAYQDCLVTAPIPASKLPKPIAYKSPLRHTAYLVYPKDRAEHPVSGQLFKREGQTYVAFMIHDLPQGAIREYRLLTASEMGSSDAHGVVVKPRGDDMDVYVGVDTPDYLFTRYTTHSGPNKPFFYPILTPDGQPMTRRWPLEADTTESHDHPHHRGLWFTHSDLNGIDFWTEQNTPKTKVGKTIARGFENIISGPIFGGFRTRTEWRAPDDKLIATDVRDVRVYEIGSDRVLDFDITITPASEPLKWGDNKDGTFGLRLPDTLAPNPDKSAKIATPTGHIESSTGLKDGAAWGKPNDWVDYYGPIGGKTYGVAMFDNPQNLRHPTTWHARDYALFSANPFGLHDFKLGDKGAGDYIQPADKPLTFRYRVFFHQGDTTAAHVAEQYQNYADPPEVTVK